MEETSGDFCYLKKYLDEVFQNAELKLVPSESHNQKKIFSFVIGATGNGGYSRTVWVTDKKTGRFSDKSFTLCCCKNSETAPEYLFLGSYFIDALDEELRKFLFERGEQLFQCRGINYLFNGDTPARAAEKLCQAAAERLELDLRRSYGISFDVVDCLSLTDYEQESAKGSLLFLAEPPHVSRTICTWLVDDSEDLRFSIQQIRTLRKMLAGATPDNYPTKSGIALLFIKKEVGGDTPPHFCGGVFLPERRDGLPPSSLSKKTVQIMLYGPLRWDLFMYGKRVCCRRSDGFHFPSSSCPNNSAEETRLIQKAITAAFTQKKSSTAAKKNLDALTLIVQAVKKQRHGAAVIIADWNIGSCKTTLDRLKKHKKAIGVDFKTTEEKIDAVTYASKMDGAVLVDVCSGEIVALAAIMDGESCLEGDPSRGARYNSIANSTNYLRNPKTSGEIVSFVFSSDGGMDILPKTKGTPKVVQE